MKQLVMLALVILVMTPLLAWAVDDQTVEQIQTEVSTTKAKSEANENKIKSLEGGLPAEQAAREAADANLQAQINNIQLIEGPEGPPGPPGPPGDIDSSAVIGALLARIEYLETMTVNADMDNDGVTPSEGDCNDFNQAINPQSAEVASDGIDNNCDGVIADFDLDGYTIEDGDCNDSNPYVFPGAFDVPGDGIDNDCDGIFPDFDQDGYSIAQGDCDDNNSALNPGAIDTPGDGLDNNCDGFIDATWSESLLLTDIYSVGYTSAMELTVDGLDSATACWEQGDYLNARNFDFENGWGPIEKLAISSYVEDRVTDASGNIFVVWGNDFLGHTLYASRYSPNDGWESHAILQQGGVSTYFESLAVDNSGNAFAVWTQNDSPSYNLYVSRYTPSTGWGVQELLEDSDGNAQMEALEVDNSGNAFVVWKQFDGTAWSLYARIYSPEYGWGAITSIEDADEAVSFKKFAIDEDQNAIVLWTQWDDPADPLISNLYARNYTQGAWGDIVTLEDVSAPVSGAVYLKFDDSGKAFTVWEHRNTGGGYSLYANHYSPVGGWSQPFLLENGNFYKDTLVVDNKGNAFVVWRQVENGFYNLLASRYSAESGGWSPEVTVDSTATYLSYNGIEVDNLGNAFVSWTKRDGVSGTPYSLYTKRYANGFGWEAVVPLESSDDDVSSFMVEIKTDNAGNAIAVWKHSGEGIDSIYANYFTLNNGWGTAGLVDYVSENESGSISSISDLEVDFLTDDKPLILWSQTEGDSFSELTDSIYSKHLVQ